MVWKDTFWKINYLIKQFLPGFNTFQLDLGTMKPYNLIMTSADITAAYGKDHVKFGDLPVH